jgi:sugar lactone lactonase YvrE
MPVYSRLRPPALLRLAQLLLPLALASAPGAQAQVFFGGGAQATVAASGLSAPEGVGADEFGNLYIADTGNNRVVRIAYTGAQTTVLSGTVLGLPLKAPYAVVADKSGNFYVADSGNNRVLKITRGGAASAVGTGLKNPSGLQVDYAEDVFIADTGNNRIEMVTAAGVQSDIIPRTDSPAGMPLSGPTGISFEDSDFLFENGVYTLIGLTIVVADTGNNRLVSVFYGGGQENRYASGGTGLKSPKGVAYYDQSIYAADTGNNRLFYLPPPESNPDINSTQVQVGTGVSSPGGMAADGSGNLYIADTANNRIVKMQPGSVDFGSVLKGAASTRTLTYVFDSDTTLSATMPIEFLSPGAPASDFSNANTGTCKAGTYDAGASCTVNAVFKPTLPGERMGAVELVDTSGTVVNKLYVHGVGIAPQIVYDPGVQTTIASGLGDALGLAVDGSGNVYIADTLNNQIDMVTPAGVMSTLASVIRPEGLAIDGAGDLYTIGFDVDFDRNDIMRVTPAGVVKGTGLDVSGPVGVAIDGQGTLYIADQFFEGLRIDFQQLDSAYAVTGGFTPMAVAVDDAGNFYVVDGTNWLVWKYTPGAEWSMVGSGYNRPRDVAVDVDGNVYVADFGNDRVVKVTPDGVQSTVGSGLIQPTRVTLDSAGNIYISDSGHHSVVKINRAAAPKLAFASTEVGKTSGDSPKEVTLENIGNAVLTFPVPSTGKNASISAGFTLGGATTCPDLSSSSKAATLAAGSTCSYEISFAPTAAGSIAGSLAMTDNDLNVSNAKQTITLSGKATAAAVKVTWTAPAPIAAGAVLGPAQLDATAGVPGKFVYSPGAGTKLAKGTHTLTATFTPADTDKYKTATAKVDLVVQ